MKNKHFYKILILIILIIVTFLGKAQNSSNCLTIEDLKKYQNSALNSLNTELSNKNWSEEINNTDETNYYFDYRLGYSVKKWQNKSTPYFEGIISLYYRSGIPNLIIYQTTNSCFIEQLGANSLTSKNSNFKSYIKREHNILIEFREYSDVTRNTRFSVLIYNEASTNELIRVEKYKIAIGNGDKFFNQGKYVEAIAAYNSALSLTSDDNNKNSINQKIANCERRIEIDKFIAQGTMYYEAKSYTEALIHFEQAKIKISPEETEILMKVEAQIKSCKSNLTQIEIKNTIAVTVNSADSLCDLNDYVKAKVKYEYAKNISGNLKPPNPGLVKELDSKISKCVDAIFIAVLLNELNKSDTAFNKAQELQINRKYNDAIREFKNILTNYLGIQSDYQSFPSIKNSIIDLRIEKSIENTRFEIEKVNNLQTTFSYASLNKNDFLYFRNKNYYLLNSLVYSEKSGMLKYDAIIEFDDLGNNKSTLNIISFSSKNIQSNLIKGVDFSGLSASQKFYYVPSHEVLNFNLRWATTIYTANSKKSQINITPYKSGKYEMYQIESFIKKQDFQRGVYKFEVIDKQLNGKNYTDINLINYRNNAGPAKAFNSAIWPGWGKHKVTNGQKGGGKALFFLLMSGITIGSKYYSDIQYNYYSNSSDLTEADLYYEKADIANKVFLVSGGIVAFTYIHDFFWVFGKGVKNNKRTKVLKESVRKGPISIYNSPLKPE